jgi:iron complex transport system substrate-binding protein
MDKPTMVFNSRVFFAAFLVLWLVACSNVLWLGPGRLHVRALDEFPMWVVDGFGRNVTIGRLPTRIVSLQPSNTEILFAIGAGDRVVGVTRYCDYPPEVLARVKDGSIKVVGGFTDPNMELIVSLRPDLVLAWGHLQKEAVSSLETKGLIVVALYPKTVADIPEDIKLVGRIVGRSDAAMQLAESLEKRINIVLDKTGAAAYKPRVYFEIWYDPLMSVGPGTYIDDLITMAGGVNIFADSKTPYPEVNSEIIIERDPEIIIVTRGYMGLAIEDAKSKIRDRPGWASISAVLNNQIYEVDENMVYRSGPRIVDGLETLAVTIHPEFFPETQLHRLMVCTSPPTLGVGFEIDGTCEKTDTSGAVSKILKKGSHTVKLLNSSIMIGANRMEFLGWTGSASGKTVEVSVYLDADAELTANYIYTTTNIPSATVQPRYVLIIATVLASAIAASLLLLKASRRKAT